MYTTVERKEARKETNHAYYVRNSGKWGKLYKKSVKGQTGTGNLGEHRNPDFVVEADLIRKELIYLGLRRGNNNDV